MTFNKHEWLKPPVLISLAGLALSLSTNYFQYSTSKEDLKLATDQHHLEKTKWLNERLKLNAEIEELKNRHERKSQDRANIQKELDFVNKSISTLEEYLTKRKLDLNLLKSDLTMIDSTKEEFLYKAKIGQIEFQTSSIEETQRKLDAKKNRRRELENRLSSQY